MIKAVVFDVGGVLCDWRTIFRQIAGEAGIKMDYFLEVFTRLSNDPNTGSELGYSTMDEFFKKFTIDLGVPEKAKEWSERFVPGFKRIEPTFTLVNELKGRYKLALLTNAKIGLWDKWEKGDLRKYFDLIVNSSEVHVIKPDERIFKILLERLKLKPEECLFIDDDEINIQAAKKLGFQTVHFKEPEESVKLIRKILYAKI